MTDPAGTPRDDDLEAAEYVLGTLDAAERSRLEQRMRGDAAARRAMDGWVHRLSGLAGRLDPVAPPSVVWERIERALAAPAKGRAGFAVIDGGAPSVDGRALAVSRGRWRTAAIALGAIAAALAVFVVSGLSPPTSAPGERYIAAVNRGGDQPALIVRVDLATRRIMVMPVAAEAPAGRSLELWYIGDDKPPRPMGVVDKSPATMPIPTGAAGAGGTFAISVEPPGGSTTGAPTGPVVYSGKLIKE